MVDRRRLDQPRETRRTLRPRIDADAFGAASERLARFFGTARYLVIQTGIVAAWIAYNVVVGVHYYTTHHNCDTSQQKQTPRCLQGLKPFDPYPFILLNLAFSTQAAYAAPLILLAQNRQADRDRVQVEQDRAQNARAVAETEYLTREVAAIRISLGEVATRDFIRSELARLLDDDERRRRSDEAR